MSEKGEEIIQNNVEVRKDGKVVENINVIEKQNYSKGFDAEIGRNIELSLEEDDKSCNSCKNKKKKIK